MLLFLFFDWKNHYNHLILFSCTLLFSRAPSTCTISFQGPLQCHTLPPHCLFVFAEITKTQSCYRRKCTKITSKNSCLPSLIQSVGRHLRSLMLWNQTTTFAAESLKYFEVQKYPRVKYWQEHTNIHRYPEAAVHKGNWMCPSVSQCHRAALLLLC